jgi:hypothetical protein
MRWRHMTWTSMVQKVPFGLIAPLRLARIARFAVGVTMGYFPCVHAQTSGTQTIVLQAGWNAVHLQVDPEPAFADDLFASLPVDSVAAFTPSSKGAQFVENPEASLLSAYGWSVWYAPHRADAFLSSLRLIHGGKSYLIHATTNTTWQLTGARVMPRTEWLADSYNLVGFEVNHPGSPTFREFFAGSPAHTHNKLYRMVEGTWRQVLDPSTAVMAPGEAFWIYCTGSSDYTGPLQVTTDSRLGLFLTESGGGELRLRNRSTHPLSLTLEHRNLAGQNVPMALAIKAYSEQDGQLSTILGRLPEGDWSRPLLTLEAGQAIRLPLELRLQDMPVGTRTSDLRVHTDLGTVFTVPVTATRADPGTPAAPSP